MNAHGPRAARLVLAAATAVAALERVRTVLRRTRGAKPRLVWGPVPITNIKYWSEAMRAAGYPSRTAVKERYAIHKREDFDVYREDFLGEGPWSERFRDLAFFIWVLRHADVVFRFFDGGFMRFTEFEAHEDRLMNLAGKKLVVSPYGADIAVKGHLAGLEDRLYADYPVLEEMTDVVETQVVRSTDEADLVVRNCQIGFIPRYDVVWLSQLTIDTALWSADGEDSGNDGSDGPVTVLHTPNHRNIKGTDRFEAAVEQLREEGLQVDFQLITGRPNEEVRRAVKDADVIADQLMLPGYGMAGIEAMAVGKPVMENIGALPAELLETEAGRECPAVDTNAENVADAMRGLVTDPDRRRELGAAGRRYVERFHDYPVCSLTWDALIGHVWRGKPLPARELPLPSPVALDPRKDT